MELFPFAKVAVALTPLPGAGVEEVTFVGFESAVAVSLEYPVVDGKVTEGLFSAVLPVGGVSAVVFCVHPINIKIITKRKIIVKIQRVNFP